MCAGETRPGPGTQWRSPIHPDDRPCCRRRRARVAEEVAWVVGADGAGIAQLGSVDDARLVGRWAADPLLGARIAAELPLSGEGTTARVLSTGRPSRVATPG